MNQATTRVYFLTNKKTAEILAVDFYSINCINLDADTYFDCEQSIIEIPCQLAETLCLNFKWKFQKEQ